MNENIKQVYNELVQVLDNEIKIYRSLLDVVRKEKDILVSAHLDDLSENNKAKEALLIKVRSLETQRIRLATEVCSKLNLDIENPRLLDIAVALDNIEGEHLRTLHSVLDLLLKRIHEFNKQNESLVKSALHNITGALKAIKNSLDENPVYKKQGKKVEGKTSSGQLVSREA
ncbi:MAG: flagellar protein FlgN [Bdellovibrionales bacterium]|nr:flagellar protein FlgN [Bdellovibrionales bacterium]